MAALLILLTYHKVSQKNVVTTQIGFWLMIYIINV